VSSASNRVASALDPSCSREVDADVDICSKFGLLTSMTTLTDCVIARWTLLVAAPIDRHGVGERLGAASFQALRFVARRPS
jgi:hypothetical protein